MMQTLKSNADLSVVSMSEPAAAEGATAQQPIGTPDMSAQVPDASMAAPVAAALPAADSAASLAPPVVADAAASTPAPLASPPTAAAPPATPASSSSPVKSAAAPGFAPLPSDAVLRSSIRTLLGASDLTRLTPKLVRAHLTKLLSLGPESEARLKKQVQPILNEEIERVHAAADKALAKEAADKAAKEKASGKTGRSPTASPSKNKKQKKSSSAEGEEDEAEAGPASKKQKTGKGSSAAVVPSVGEDEIERMAAEAEADNDDEDGSEAPEQPAAAAAAASKSEDADALMAQELANSERRPRRAAAKPASVKKASAPRKKKEVDPNAPAKPKKMAAISEALQAFFDYKYGAEMNRGEVVKLLWVYIKEHKCQDPKDGRRILLDDKLKTIFGEHRKFVQMMGMNKDLQKHIKNKDQLTG